MLVCLIGYYRFLRAKMTAMIAIIATISAIAATAIISVESVPAAEAVLESVDTERRVAACELPYESVPWNVAVIVHMPLLGAVHS